MSCLLIIQNDIDKAPYVSYYIDVFKECGVEFRVLYWNRSMSYCNQNTFITYNNPFSGNNVFLKIYSYIKFYIFCYLYILKNKCNNIISFSITTSIFLSPILLIKYRNKYILDIRDYSPLAKYLKWILFFVIKKSRITFISSFGFRNWLPMSNYVLSHNVSRSLLENNLYNYNKIDGFDNCLNILTIGQIRDFNINKKLIDLLGNKDRFKLTFSGYSNVYNKLEMYSNSNKVLNIDFIGRYIKSDEASIVKSCSFINALTSNNILSNFLITNRFYLSVLYCRPIIVFSNTYQAELVEKYKLGIVIDDVSRLVEYINNYILSFDFDEFYSNCLKCRFDILNDTLFFEDQLKSIIK